MSLMGTPVSSPKLSGGCGRFRCKWVNFFMPLVAEKRLVILGISLSLFQRHLVENMFRSNVSYNPRNNSPFNILCEFCSIKKLSKQKNHGAKWHFPMRALGINGLTHPNNNCSNSNVSS